MQHEFKRIFITGGTGLLGHYLIDTAPRTYEISCSYFPVYKRDAIPGHCTGYCIDIRDRTALLDALRIVKPDYVIHTASIANVDYVEQNKDEAKVVNLEGTINVIKACLDVGAKLIHTSSNAIFDGQTPPYSEDSPINPINYYGMLKAEEEEEVKKSGIRYAIIRPILMYGWNLSVERKNPVTWLIDILKDGKEIKVVDDIFCNPLFTKDCADVIWEVIGLNKSGIYHVGGEDGLSRYEFAIITAEVFGLNKKLVSPVSNAFFKEIAPRPQNTTYSIEKIKKELQVFPLGVREGLRAMKANKNDIS